MGSPAVPVREFMRTFTMLRKLARTGGKSEGDEWWAKKSLDPVQPRPMSRAKLRGVNRRCGWRHQNKRSQLAKDRRAQLVPRGGPRWQHQVKHTPFRAGNRNP